MTKPHTFSLLDADLDRIRELILTMGGRVEQAIMLAARALDTRDEELALQVVQADKAIDAMEEEINTEIVRILALRQPKADDLRAVVAVMKMAGDLERIGDYAKNMARRVSALAVGQQIEGAGAAIRRQARQVGQMLKDMLDAYARGDVALAEDVIARDAEVDHMTNALFREFITHMMEDPRNITACLHYTFIAKNTERMGDLVTAAAEQIVFMGTGQRVHERPKGTSTAEMPMPEAPGA
jgi:phosphate transport system protein